MDVMEIIDTYRIRHGNTVLKASLGVDGDRAVVTFTEGTRGHAPVYFDFSNLQSQDTIGRLRTSDKARKDVVREALFYMLVVGKNKRLYVNDNL